MRSLNGLNVSSSIADRIFELFSALDVYINGTTFTTEEHQRLSESVTYTKHNIMAAQVRDPTDV